MDELVVPIEVDRRFRWKPGTAERMARRGKIRHFLLPNGEVRFTPGDIDDLLVPQGGHGTGQKIDADGLRRVPK